MSPNEIEAAAIAFANANKSRIAKSFISGYLPDPHPVSAFMAGSPGAGKTEFSKELLIALDEDGAHRVMRIDSDELRSEFPDYTGTNSSLFQGAASVLVERIHDLAIDRKLSFILDGTFSRYGKAELNISRSLKHERAVVIFYVYQTPTTAWRFTEARERLEGRNIPKTAFVAEFCAAKATVEQVHTAFGDRVAIYVVKKDFTTSAVREMVRLVGTSASIDEIVGETYTKDQLAQML